MTIGNAGRDLLVYLALLVPLEFIMTSPRVAGRAGDKRRGVTVAMGVLLTLSAVKLGVEIMHKEASYYDLIDVAPDAPSSELKKGYKRASLKVHPDKLQAAAAAGETEDEGGDEAFLALKAAYDILSDSYQRDLYNKFGKPGIEAKDDTTNLLAGLGFFYVVWLALAYLLTQRKSVGRAQTWSFTGLLALAIFEYQACILSFDFLQEALPNLVMFEKIELLHRLYPIYLLSSRMIAWMLYEDVDAHNFVMLQHLHWKTDRLRERLAMVAAQRNGSADGGAVQWDALAKAAASQQVTANGAGVGAVSSPAPPLGVAASPQPGAGVPAARAQPARGGGGRNISSLIWFFGVYFFFQWLLGRGS